MSSTTTNYGFKKPGGGDSPSLPIWLGGLADDVDKALHDQVTGTSGTWTPSVSWALSGSWAGAYRQIGSLVVAQASITTTAVAAAWPGSDTFTVTGLPFTASMLVGGSCLVGWGTRPHPAFMSVSTIYVSLVNKTSTLPPSGTLIVVAAAFLVS